MACHHFLCCIRCDGFVFVLVVSLVVIAPGVVVIVIVIPVVPSLIDPGPLSA